MTTASGLVPPGYAYIEFPDIDSTNEEARRRADAGEPGPLWIRADLQTAGRGRRGRGWVSPTGNLMCTLLVRPACTAQTGALLSFVTAVTVAEFLEALVPEGLVSVKWPNDILIGGAKSCGILLESAAGGGGALDWMAIGIGINLKHFPPDMPYKVTSVAAAAGGSPVPDPREAFTRLAAGFDRWYRAFDGGLGFEVIRKAWLARAVGLGQTIAVTLASGSCEGRFDGLDPSGALRLTLGDGQTRAITAGEVFFPETGGRPPSTNSGRG